MAQASEPNPPTPAPPETPETPESPEPPETPESPVALAGGGGRAERAAPMKLPGATSASSVAVMSPPRRREAVWDWLGLLLCLAVASPAILVEVQRHRVLTADAAESVIVARELTATFGATLRASGVGLEPLVPLLEGREALVDPPGTAWAYALSHAVGRWLAGDDAATDARSWVLAARWASVVAAMVLIASVYWAGMAIGGVRPALFSGLIAAGNPLLAWEVRVADGSVLAAMWVALSVAASLWAIRPLRPVAGLPRQAIGWGVAGVALGMAVLTLGPTAWLAVVLPVLAVLIACPHRLSHALGLIASMLAAVLFVLPWVALAQERQPSVLLIWLTELNLTHVWVEPLAVLRHAGWRTLGLTLVFVPWLVWLVSAVLQPFSASSQGVRLRMMLGWLWLFLSWGYVMMLPSVGAWGGRVDAGLGWSALWSGLRSGAGSELLLVLPGAAVLLGQLFRRLTELAEDGRPARVWRWLRWPHASVILAVSVLVGVCVLVPGGAGWIGNGYARAIESTAPWVLGLWVAALLAAAMLGLRLAWKHRPGRASAMWSVWIVVLLTGLLAGASQREATTADYQRAADVINGVVSPTDWLVQLPDSPRLESPVYGLSAQAQRGYPPASVDPRVRLYLQRVVPVLEPREAVALAKRAAQTPGRRVVVLVPAGARSILPDTEPIPISSPLGLTLLRVGPGSADPGR